MSDEKQNDPSRPRSIDAIGGELRAVMAAEEPQQSPRGRCLRWSLVAAAAAACVIAVSAVLVSDGNEPFTVESAVAAVNRAALDAPRAHPDEYLYTRSRSISYGGRSTQFRNDAYKWMVRVSQTREAWSRPGHTSWTRTVTAPVEYPTEGDREIAAKVERRVRADWDKHNPGRKPPSLLFAMATDEKEGSDVVCKLDPELSSFAVNRGGRAIPGIKNSELPKTAPELYRFLLSRTEKSVRLTRRQGWVWEMIGNALGSGSAGLSPAQRGVLLGALAEIPRVKTFGEVEDPTGRAAIGFSHTGLGKVRRIYFDRETGLTTYSDTVSSNGRPVEGVESWQLENYEYVAKPPKLTPSKGRSLSVLLACPDSRLRRHYSRARG